MTDKNIAQQHHATFEGIRHVDADGNEFWLARPLARVLDYSEYRHFLPVIERAREACRNSGHPMADHFEEILEMVEIGSGARRELPDVRLSRYACYLIVQNGDPGKPVIANGQTYFATQTEEKLRRERVCGKEQANQTHFEVGARCARPSRNWAASCRRTCLNPIPASGRSNRRKGSWRKRNPIRYTQVFEQ